MEIIRNDKHVLIKTLAGEYHFSHEEFDRIGEEAAVKKAKEEIEKKRTKHFTGTHINFEKATALGFCEYGIKDFCDILTLDINKEYEVEYLKSILTEEVIERYPDECLKVFGTSMLDKFGGPTEYLRKTKNIRLILREEFIPAVKLHELACDFAESVLHNFENEYPKDKRPRKAIEMKRRWIEANRDDL